MTLGTQLRYRLYQEASLPDYQINQSLHSLVAVVAILLKWAFSSNVTLCVNYTQIKKLIKKLKTMV